MTFTEPQQWIGHLRHILHVGHVNVPLNKKTVFKLNFDLQLKHWGKKKRIKMSHLNIAAHSFHLLWRAINAQSENYKKTTKTRRNFPCPSLSHACVSISEKLTESENMAESSRTWQVACGTQNWIQLVRWFRLISAAPLRRERWCALWANGEQRFYAVQHL